MRNWRVCVDADGVPLSIAVRLHQRGWEYRWGRPSFKLYPGTPPGTKWVHVVNAIDELDAYKTVMEMPRK